MLFHIHSLKARATEAGRPVTWQQIADGTGIRRPTLFKIAGNEARVIRPEYIDALCTFFGVTTGELMTAESVKVPLELAIRPDRRGKPIGRQAKARPSDDVRKEEES
jgi:hypothetical protein